MHSALYLRQVESGTLTVTALNRATRCQTGELLCFPSGLIYTLRPPRGEEARAYTLRLRRRAFALQTEADREIWNLLLALTKHVWAHGPKLNLHPETRHALLPLLELGSAEYESQHALKHARLKVLALEVLTRIRRDPVLTLPEQARVPEAVLKVIWYLEEHFADPLSVKHLSRVAGLGRSQFQAVFKAATGQSVLAYLTDLRIAHACRLLREDGLPVLEAGLASGFGSASRFHAAFKSALGVSPAAYRRG